MKATLELRTQEGTGAPVTDARYTLGLEAIPAEGQWVQAPDTTGMYQVKSVIWVVERTPLVPELQATPYIVAERWRP